MKQLLTWLGAIFLVLFILPHSNFKVLASEKSPAVLFYSDTCPHCQNVAKQLTEKGYREKINLAEKEVSKDKKNSEEFFAALKVCAFPSEQAGVPMLFSNQRCYMGELDVMNELTRLAGETTSSPFVLSAINSDAKVSATPVVLPELESVIPHEEAKRNTLIFISVMTLAMVALVAVGYWKQGSEGKNIKKKALMLIAIFSLLLALPIKVQAFCPVCTVAVGAGLGVSKYLGIDDVISGVWIGGLTLSMSLWTINWLTSKKIKFFGRQPLIVLAMYALVIVPLQWGNMIGNPGNTLWGQDKILLGMFFGTIGFITGFITNLILLSKNNKQVYFPFQKVVLPITAMILLNLFFYFIVY